MVLNANTVQDPFSRDDYIYRRTYTVAGNVEYEGRARPGTAEATAGWQIKRTTYDGSDQAIATGFANGNHDYVHVWNNGGSLLYSSYDYS